MEPGYFLGYLGRVEGWGWVLRGLGLGDGVGVEEQGCQ